MQDFGCKRGSLIKMAADNEAFVLDFVKHFVPVFIYSVHGKNYRESVTKL